jgi:ADP-ribose pyrophosphatase
MDLVFDCEAFSVRRVSREVRSVRQDYEIVVRPQVALSIPITSDGHLVLVRQFRAGADGFILEFPAGRLTQNEDPEHAARRELLEETGFRVDTMHRIGTLLTAPHFSDESIVVFVAAGEIAADPTPTPKEDLRVIELPPPGVAELIANGHIIDCKTIAAHALARSGGAHFGVTL